MAVIKKFYEGDNNVSLDTTRGRSKFSIKINGNEVSQLHVVERQLADKIPVKRPGCYFNYQKSPCKPSNLCWRSVFDVVKEFLRDNNLEFRGSLTYEGPLGPDGNHHTLSRRYHLPFAARGHYVVVRDTHDMVHLLTVAEKDELYEIGMLKSAIVRSDVSFTPNGEENLKYESFSESPGGYRGGAIDYYPFYLSEFDSCRNVVIDGRSRRNLRLGIELCLDHNTEKGNSGKLYIPTIGAERDDLGFSDLITVNIKIIGNRNINDMDVIFNVNRGDVYLINCDFECKKYSFIKFIRKISNQIPDRNFLSGYSLRRAIIERFPDVRCFDTGVFDGEEFLFSHIKNILNDFESEITLSDFLDKYNYIFKGNFKTNEEFEKELIEAEERRIAEQKDKEITRMATERFNKEKSEFDRKYNEWLKENRSDAESEIHNRMQYINKGRKAFKKMLRLKFLEETGMEAPVLDDIVKSLQDIA